MLGITDASVEGEWLTFDGKQTSFTNWNTGEPGGGTPKSYAFAYPASTGVEYPGGTWNDVGSIFYPGTYHLCTYEPLVP